MTLLFYYVLANILFATAGLVFNVWQDKPGLEDYLEEFYKETEMSKTATTIILVLMLAFFAIPTFIYTTIKGDK